MSCVDHWWGPRSNPRGGSLPFGITALRRLPDPGSRSDDLDFFLEDSAGDELPDLDLNTLDWYEAKIPIAAFGLTFAQAEIGRPVDWNDPKFVAHEREREKRISSVVKTGGGWKSFLDKFPVIATLVDGKLYLVDGWHRLKLAQKDGIKTTIALIGLPKSAPTRRVGDFFARRNPADRWAYHATTASALSHIARHGLLPSASSITRRGNAVVFFTGDAYGAYRYFIDREDPVLLRFPWPSDAVKNADEFTSAVPVMPSAIELYDGKLLNGLGDAYYLADMEERFEVLERFSGRSDRIENARAWTFWITRDLRGKAGLARPVAREAPDRTTKSRP